MTRDPDELRPLRPVEGLVRGRFEIEHDGWNYVVDSLYLDLDERIRLYRDGRLVDTARRKASFRLHDGAQIEAAAAQVGMKYVRLRPPGSPSPVPLAPAPGTAEAWRAGLDRSYPAASRAIGRISLGVLLVALIIELPQLVNLLGQLTPLLGLAPFQVPALALSGWANLAVVLVAGAAGLERSLSMRYHPLLDD